MKRTAVRFACIALLIACGETEPERDAPATNHQGEDESSLRADAGSSARGSFDAGKNDAGASDAPTDSPHPNVPGRDAPDAAADGAMHAPADSTLDARVPFADDSTLSTMFEQRVRQCGGFGEGRFSSDYFAVQDGYDRCVVTCFLEASCDHVRRKFCGASLAQPLDECVRSCSVVPADGFDCGDGTRIPSAFVCDLGTLDCPDGRDELDCADPFQCGDGTRVPGRLVCDGAAHCEDASDEPAECAKCTAPY